MKKIKKRKSQQRLDNEEPHYSTFLSLNWTIEIGKKCLANIDKMVFALASAPIIDGLLISCLVNGLMSNIMEAVVFGMTAFSGGACIGAVINSQKSFFKEFISIFTVYFLILVFSLSVAIVSPVFKSAAPENLTGLTAIFLIALGLKISGIKKAQRFFGVTPGSAIRVLIFSFFIKSMRLAPMLVTSQDMWLFFLVVISVLSGFFFTCLGLLLRKLTILFTNFDYSYLKIGQAGSLILVGLKLIFPVFPTWLALVPIISGFIMGFFIDAIKSKIFLEGGKNDK